MLTELRVENLLLIEDARLDLAEGLSVLTGETGAGKTVLAHALDLLLGGRARPSVVRPGAAEAYVEGIFELDDALRERLGERIAADAAELVLARRVSAEGRSRALINGRSATATDLREVASEVVVFYGQHEHQRLMLTSTQLEVLDAACGPGHRERLAAWTEAFGAARSAQARCSALADLVGATERELDLLEFELAEIENVDPSADEETELLAIRDRLRHIDSLRRAAATALEALTADGGGAAETLAAGGGALQVASGLDPRLDNLGERWVALLVDAQDLASELRSYTEGLEAEPGALDQVEDRLAQIDRLKRKHGGTVASVLDHAASCRARRDELVGADVALDEAQQELDVARSRLVEIGAELTTARRTAIPTLEREVRSRLADLAMAEADFSVSLSQTEPGQTGVDGVEFMLAPNPGVAATPLRETASGGELSRVMLALLGAVNIGATSALVFDEIDAGIGGHTARAVGEQLRRLSDGRQVICITHLPQVAAHGTRHFSIEKDTSSQPTRTTVERLEDAQVVGELVRMLGAADDDLAARRHAKALLSAA